MHCSIGISRWLRETEMYDVSDDGEEDGIIGSGVCATYCSQGELCRRRRCCAVNVTIVPIKTIYPLL